MSDPSTFDPFAVWRDMLSQIEKVANQAANAGMKSEHFSRGMNVALQGASGARKAQQDAMRRALEALNIPTRADIAAIGDRLQAIEERLLVLCDSKDIGTSAGAFAGNALPRTRKPPDTESAKATTPRIPTTRKRSRARP